MAVDATVALVSLADVKAFLKIPSGTTSEDDLLEDLIDAMSKNAIDYCGRNFVSKARTEYYDGNGTDHLIVRNFPIITLTSLNIDGNRDFGSSTDVDLDEDVLLDKGSGVVRLWNNEGRYPTGKANVKIVYTAGYATIPYDLAHAVKIMVMYVYKRHYQDQRIGLQSETIGDRNMTYSNEDIPKSAKLVLDKYKYRGGADNGYEA